MPLLLLFSIKNGAGAKVFLLKEDPNEFDS